MTPEYRANWDAIFKRTPSKIAKEALLQLENNLVMANLVARDYKKEYVKIGDTVSVRRAVKFSIL